MWSPVPVLPATAPRRVRGGHTLVELVVVLAILAVIATVSLSGFGSVGGGGRDRMARAAVELAIGRAAAEASRFPSDTVAVTANGDGSLVITRNGVPVPALAVVLPPGYTATVGAGGAVGVTSDGTLTAATSVRITAADANTTTYTLDRAGTLH